MAVARVCLGLWIAPRSKGPTIGAMSQSRVLGHSQAAEPERPVYSVANTEQPELVQLRSESDGSVVPLSELEPN
jgi:hypothetical protein